MTGVKLYRFYFADGRVKRLAASRAPWTIRDYDGEPPAVSDDVSSPAAFTRRTFQMRRYDYGVDFVGPHRDSDFHEAP